MLREGWILLTPNYRLARHIKATWDNRRAESGDRTWQTSPVFPLESWLLQQWRKAVVLGLLPSRLPLGSNEALEIWRQVIVQQESAGDEYHLLRPAAAAEIALQARENLVRWQVDVNDAAISQQFELDRDCMTFLQWLRLFEERLATDGLTTDIDCIRELGGVADRLPRHKVLLIECDEIPPLFNSVLAAQAEAIDQFFTKDQAGEQQVHAFADRRSELQAAARWAYELSRTSPQASIGIVLSDMNRDRTSLEYLLRREFSCLGDSYTSLPVNFSTGISLLQAPVVRDALAALAMGLQQTTVPAVVRLLQSRFLNLPDRESPLALHFIQRLYEQGSEILDVADLRYNAARVRLGESEGLALGQILLSMSTLRSLGGAATASVWGDRFCQVLEQWGWPGTDALDSLEYQQVELWYRTLEQFKAYDAVCQGLEYPQALTLLRDTCAKQVSQPQTASGNIQVLGSLEAAGLAFDHLWLCGMQAANWPPPARPNPFIPLSLQSRLRMPHATAEREWEFCHARILQYTRCARDVHASFSWQTDGIIDMPSPLLSDFTEIEYPEVPAYDDSWTTNAVGAQLERLSDDIAPPVDLARPVAGGSALLEDQSQCPFRAYARRRLAVEALPDFSLALSPAQRGSLLHDALYTLWGELEDSETLQALDSDSQEALVNRAVSAAVKGLPEVIRRHMGGAYWQLESQRLVNLLNDWLLLERQRKYFVVSQREEDVSLEVEQLNLRLRVDRIDQIEGGSRVIIDYKSGSCSVQDWLGERPARPQLLLYGIAFPDSTAALAFAQVKQGSCRYVGIGEVEAAPGVKSDISAAVGTKMEAADWSALNRQWRENIAGLARAFVAGQASVDPLSTGSCTWCGLQPLCRVASLRAPGEAADS